MIARHSILEVLLAEALYKLAGVDPKIGRVAVGNPRGGEILGRMQELAEILRLDMSPFPWSAFKKTLDDLKKRRDWFAHSPWAYDVEKKKYILFVMSGKSKPDAPYTTRKIWPEGMVITASDLRALIAEIDKAIEQADTLDRFVRLSLQIHKHASPSKQP